MLRALHHLTVVVVLAAGGGCATRSSNVALAAAAEAAEASATTVFLNGTPQALREQLALRATEAGYSIHPPGNEANTATIVYRGEPKNYIECGSVVSVIKGSKGERRYEFPAATALQRYELASGRQTLAIERRIELEATVRVTLTPVSAQRTRAVIESYFLVTREQSVLEKPNNFVTRSSIGFLATEEAALPDSTAQCGSTGQIETEVRAMLNERG